MEDNKEDKEFSPFATAEACSKLLKGLSNRQKREVLNLLASQSGMRVVPAGVPIGNLVGKTQSQGKPAPKSTKVVKAQAPKVAEWKQSPEWKAAESKRSAVVDLLKQAPEGQKAPLELELRECEAHMKALRNTLRAGQGNGQPSSQS